MAFKLRKILVLGIAAAIVAGCDGSDRDAEVPHEPSSPGDDTPAVLDPGEELETLREGDLMPAWQEGCLDIHSINGGRGESFYYIMPDGTTMLLDCGYKEKRPASYVEAIPDSPSGKLRAGDAAALRFKVVRMRASTSSIANGLVT